VLKHPKNPTLNKNKKFILLKLDATKIPKKNEDMKLTIAVF